MATAAGASTSAAAPHGGPTPRDSILAQELTILPDLPPSALPDRRSEKLKEVERDAVASAAAPSAAAPSWEEEQPDAPVPSYVENSLLDPGTAAVTGDTLPTASTSAGWLGAESAPSRRTNPLPPSGYALSASYDAHDRDHSQSQDVDDHAEEEEEEYDGYEELSLSASLSERPPPPRIDDDISPPSAAEPSSAFGYRLAADSGEVVIIDGVGAGAGGDAGADHSRRTRHDDEGDDELPPLPPPPPPPSGLGSGPGPEKLAGLSPPTPPPPSEPPETPPPPVDYDLSAPPPPPCHFASVRSTGLARPPPPPPPPPIEDDELPIPSSPPPPLSPLFFDPAILLPPFSPHLAPVSAALPAQARTPLLPPPQAASSRSPARDPRRHARDSSEPHMPNGDLGMLPPRPPPPLGSGSPEGLPPPYAGRSHSSLPLEMSSPSRPARNAPVLDAPPGRPRGARHPAHNASTTPRSPTDAPASMDGHRERAEMSLPAALEVLPEPYPPYDGGGRQPVADDDDHRLREEQHHGGDGAMVEDESRPPPYEQRDESALATNAGNGIQWGMMHMTNRRGELVL